MKVSIAEILVMLIECINFLDAQKYWSCDPNCPLRCNKREQSSEDVVCCFIPDVTMLSITFTTVCHFDCANKCYSGGLRIHNKGTCEGRPSSSESDSMSVEQIGPTTPGLDEVQDDAFGLGSRTEKDVFNETSVHQERIDALEQNAVINDKEKVSGRLFNSKTKHHHHHSKKKTITTENTNYDIENVGTINDMWSNDIGDDDTTVTPDLTEIGEEEDMENTKNSDGTRMGKKISRIQTPTNEEGETVNNFEETPILPTNDLTTVMSTTSPINVSTKKKHKKKKKEHSRINHSTISEDVTDENAFVITTLDSLVDMINVFPTTVSPIETFPAPTNPPEKKKHKKKKGSKSKNDSTLPLTITEENTMATTTTISSIVDMINLFPTTASFIETSPLPTNTPAKRKHKKKKEKISKNDVTTASPNTDTAFE